jgi:hypothetical protein
MNIINYSDKWPKYLIYDNGCNTEKYILKHLKQTTLRSQILKKTKLIVDRCHFITHKDSHIYCKENCNPDNFEDLKNVNTESCEQANYWFSGYKHSTKHMNDIRFYFFNYVICNEYNKNKLISHKYMEKRTFSNK